MAGRRLAGPRLELGRDAFGHARVSTLWLLNGLLLVPHPKGSRLDKQSEECSQSFGLGPEVIHNLGTSQAESFGNMKVQAALNFPRSLTRNANMQCGEARGCHCSIEHGGPASVEMLAQCTLVQSSPVA